MASDTSLIGKVLYNASGTRIGEVIDTVVFNEKVCFLTNSDKGYGKYWCVDRLNNGKENNICISDS